MGDDTNITLSSTFSTPTSTQLGYVYTRSSCTVSAITSGSTYVFCPSAFSGAPVLAPGAYIASVQYTLTPSVLPQNSNTDQQFGIGFSTTGMTPSSNAEGLSTVVTLADNQTYTSFNQTRWYRSSSLYFTVPTGNTNAYFAFGYVGLGSSSGGSFTPCVTIQSIVKIA